jgi:hypothetical protein
MKRDKFKNVAQFIGLVNNDKVQNPNEKREWFWHLSIWILTFEICWGNYKNLEVKNEDNT